MLNYKREYPCNYYIGAEICTLPCLYMPAMCALRHNKLLSEFYHRLLSNGKIKMVALVAVMRKMLALAIGILNNGIPFDENWVIKYQENFAIAS
jgi:hypothetical protein